MKAGRSRGSFVLTVLFVVAAAVATDGAGAQTVTNPHDTTRPDYCLDCHDESIYRHECDDPAGFCLLADSVDGLCLLCHIAEDCCRTGQRHQSRLYLGKMRHPSDVDVSDTKKAYLPKTLPIHNGRISCRTCHLHTRKESGDYKMLRIVKRIGSDVDWSVLCADCHDENY